MLRQVYSDGGTMKLNVVLILTLLLGPTAGSALEQNTPGPKDSTGLPATDIERISAGDLAPDFTLESKDSSLITLSDYRGKKNVVLVFYRGHW